MSRHFAVSLFLSLPFAAAAQTCPPPQQVTIVPGSGCETYIGARPYVRCSVGTPITLSLRRLTGQAFLPACTVTFGGVASGNVTHVSPVSLTAVAPPHGAGVVDVAITCGTDHDTLASSFTYLALPIRSRAVRH